MMSRKFFSSLTATRKRRVLLWCLLIFVAVVSAGHFILHSSSFKRYLIGRIDRYLRNTYQLTLDVKEIRYSLSRLAVELKDVELKTIDPQNSTIQLFSAERLFGNMALTLSKKIHIQKIEITGPKLVISQGKQPKRKSAEGQRKHFLFRIDKFTLEQGLLSYNNNQYGLDGSFSGIKAGITYSKKEKMHRGVIAIDSGGFQYGDSLLSVRDLDLRFKFDDHRIEIDRLSVDSDMATVRASGQIRDYQGSPRVDLRLESTVPLELLQRMVSPGMLLSGLLSLNASIEGGEKKFSISGKLRGKDLAVNTIPVSDLEAAFDGNEKAISISRLSSHFAGGSLEGRARISFVPEERNVASLEWNSLNLDLLSQTAPQLPLAISSKTSGAIEASWSMSNLEELEGGGTVSFTPAALNSRTEKPASTLEGSVQFTMAREGFEIKRSKLKLDKNALIISGKLDKSGNLDTELQVKAGDLRTAQDILLKMNHVFDPKVRQMIAGRTIQGGLTFSGRASGNLKNPRFSLEIESPGIGIDQLSLKRLSASAAYENELIAIKMLHIGFQEGTLEGSGSISFSPVTRIIGKSADLSLRLTDINIGPIAALASERSRVSGRVSGEATIKGGLPHPEARFWCTVENPGFNSRELSRLSAEGRLEDTELILNELNLKEGGNSLYGNLSFNTKTGQYSVHLAAERMDLTGFQSLFPKGKMSGNAEFWLRGEGTLDAPLFSLEAKATQLSILGTRVDRLEWNVDSDGKTVSSNLHIPEWKTEFQANMKLEQPYVVSGTLATEKLKIEEVLKKMEGNLLPLLSGELTATTSFRIPLQNIEESSADLTIERVSLISGDRWLQNNLPVEIQISEKRLAVRKLHLQGAGTELIVSGSLPLSAAAEGKIKVEGTIDMRLFKGFAEKGDFGGTLTLFTEVEGNLKKPLITTDITLKEGLLSHPRIPYRMDHVSFRLHGSQNVLMLEHFTSDVDGGKVTARGRLALPTPLTPSAETPPSSGRENEIEVEFSNISLDKLGKFRSNAFLDELGGVVGGTIRLRGKNTEFSQVEGKGEISLLQVSISDVEVTNVEPIRFEMKGGILSLKDVHLAGDRAVLEMEAKADIRETPELDVQLKAEMDSAVLTPFLTDTILGGLASLNLSISGPLAHPEIRGKGAISNGFFQLMNYPVLATDIRGEIVFEPETILLTSLRGELNGGPVTIEGKLRYSLPEIESGRLELRASHIQLNYPKGLFGTLGARLTLEGRQNSWLVTGEGTLIQAYFGEDVYLGTQILSAIRTRRLRRRVPIPHYLQNLKLDLGISIAEPFVIDNNIANLEFLGNVRVTGTVGLPILSGRIKNRLPGEIVFGANAYQVEQATLDFLGTELIDPTVYVVAHTAVSHGYDELDVVLTFSGPISQLGYSLSSSPPRSPEELASLLITGHGLSKVKSQTTTVIGDQLLLYFTTPLASPLTQRIKRLLGAEEVYIEPINIATEEDPGARFTFRKRLSKEVSVVYSLDVTNSQRQTWMVDYNLSRDFSIRSFRKDDGSYGSSIRHRFSLTPRRGEPKQAAPAKKGPAILEGTAINGNLVFPPEVIHKKIKLLKQGSKFLHSRLRNAIDDLLKFHKRNNYLNAVITPNITYGENENVSIVLNISPGKPIFLEYTGHPLSKKLKDRIVEKWNGHLPEKLALIEAKKLILSDFQRRGFYDAAVVEGKVERDEDIVYTFSIRKGKLYRIRNITFRGNNSIPSKAIMKSVRQFPSLKAKGNWIFVYDSRGAREAIETLYGNQGFLEAVVSPPTISMNREQQILDISLTVEEGLQSRVSGVEFRGNKIFHEGELREGLQLIPGEVYRTSTVSNDRSQIVNLYRSRGYLDAEIKVDIFPDASREEVLIRYQITEGAVHRIAEIEIIGHRRSKTTIIRKELDFREGEELNPAKLASSQKKLYDTGNFRSVNIISRPLDEEIGLEKVTVQLEEEPLLSIAYGLRYSSDEKLEGLGELSFNNIFGTGRQGLIHYRQSSKMKDLRFSLSEPYLFGLKLNTLYSFSYMRDIRAFFISDELRFSLQQQLNLPFQFSLSYLYRLTWVHTFELDPIGPFPFDITLFLSEISTFLVRDTRNNKLDSQQGSFFSLSLTYSPSFLGSDLTYISAFLQYSFYTSILPNFIWASNYRIGMADAFDQILIPSKRFFAGGGNSIRGFKRDMVGPIDPFFLRPDGGEGLFVINQELRFPVYKWLGGVVFYDTGNIYTNLGGFYRNPFDLRHSIGFGIRLNTPISLIRVDYGINLFPRPDEPRGVFFFSIGQAF